MDKLDNLLKFFKNVWFKRAVAVICWVYTGITIWVAYLSFGYYFDFDNPRSLFVLYLFVNVAAMGLMILSRKQVITQINAYVLPLAVFVLVILGFGNWYMVIPPAVVAVVLFFANSSNETLKTVVGTMYLLLYVIGIVGYITAQMFMGRLTFTDVDLNNRDKSYEKVSPSGGYRIVRYLETDGDRKLQRYYIEKTEDDIHIPMGVCKRVYGSYHLNTASYTDIPSDLDSWTTRREDGETQDVPVVEGRVCENPYLIKKIDKTEITGSSSSAQSTSPEESSGAEDDAQ